MHAAEQTGVRPKLVVHLSVSYDMHLTQNPIHKTRRTSSLGMTAGFNRWEACTAANQTLLVGYWVAAYKRLAN